MGTLVECLEISGHTDAGGGFVGADLFLCFVVGVNLNSFELSGSQSIVIMLD